MILRGTGSVLKSKKLSTAVTGAQTRTKVFAAEEDEAPLVVAVSDQAGKTKAKRRARKREAKGSEGEVSVAEVDEVLAVQQGAFEKANQSGARGESYATVARGSAPPRDFVYPPKAAQMNAPEPVPQPYRPRGEMSNQQRDGQNEPYEDRAGAPDQTRAGNTRRGQGDQRTQFVGPCFA